MGGGATTLHQLPRGRLEMRNFPRGLWHDSAVPETATISTRRSSASTYAWSVASSDLSTSPRSIFGHARLADVKDLSDLGLGESLFAADLS